MNRLIFFFLPVVASTLLFGLLSGLVRMGWELPVPPVVAHHGAVMVGSFMGSLIIMERVSVFRKIALWIIPLINLSSILFFSLGMPELAFAALFVGSLGLCAIAFYFYKDLPSLSNLTQIIGSLCYAIGCALLFKTSSYPVALPWWLCFILFIIVGERLFLTRYLPDSKTKTWLFVLILCVTCLGLVIPFHAQGVSITGIGLIGFALWLCKYDMATKSIKLPGQHRYTGILLLVGYVFLLLSGVFLLIKTDNGLSYDLFIHTFFLGFMFTMVFAHGPIIFPGILGLTVKPYRSFFYIWFCLLIASVSLRIIGDITLDFYLRSWSGLFSTVSILGFFVSMATMMTIEVRKMKAVRK
jgi:uncharacterized membrane protein YagU involved in acid resistance